MEPCGYYRGDAALNEESRWRSTSQRAQPQPVMATMAGSNRPACSLTKMFQFSLTHSLFLVLILNFCDKTSTEILRPRGVPITQANLYDPSRNFKCLDGSDEYPPEAVNDDYCDCADGSDEPGTAACPHGKFYCVNAGHVAGYIPSSRVNDRICDCCDGEDEYDTLVDCPNTCLELGKSARLAAQQHAELMKQGSELRAELIKKGLKVKNDKTKRVDQLKQDKAEADRLKSEYLALKEAAEEKEREALDKYRKEEEEEKARLREEQAKEEEKEAFEQFQRLDSDSDGIVVIADIQTRQTFDKDRNGEVSEEEARYFLDGAESISWEIFLATGWLRMKPYILMEKGLFTPPITTDTTTVEPEVEAGGVISPGEEEKESEDAEQLDQESVEDQMPEEHDDEEGYAEDKGETEPEESEHEPEAEPPVEPVYDQHTLDLIEAAKTARKDLDDAETSARNIEKEITDIVTALNKDYGPEEEFATLEGACFDYTDAEYTYQFCPFEEVVQKPRSGASPTRLGGWGNWAGPPDNKYSVMMYDRGVSCWNGPQRTAQVNIKCGLESALISATEPNRCEYLLEFTTPAACIPTVSQHDEL